MVSRVQSRNLNKLPINYQVRELKSCCQSRESERSKSIKNRLSIQRQRGISKEKRRKRLLRALSIVGHGGTSIIVITYVE